jgi:hypothetical protein
VWPTTSLQYAQTTSYFIRYIIQNRSIVRVHNSLQLLNMVTVIILKHSENSNDAVAKEILDRFRNGVRQRLNFFVKPLYHFTNSAAFSWVRQAFQPDLINHCLQFGMKFVKLLAMAHTIFMKFHVNSCYFIHSFGLFMP